MDRRTEQYQDQLGRLFPEEAIKGDGEPGKMPHNVTFALTDACSLRCSYCYQGIKSNHVLSFETAKKFIDLILRDDSDYINTRINSGVIIEFIGGEPLLEIDLMDQITDYFIGEMIRLHHPWANRFRLSICSNGTEYFNPKWQKFLKKHKAHLSFSISIDGNKELHDACRKFPDGRGSYDIAIAGVKHFRDVYDGFMGSKMTLAPGNVMYTFDALTNLIALGYNEINLNCVYEKGWTVEHAKILYEQLKKCSDYLVENHLNDDLYISIFENRFFRPKKEGDLQNWCGGTGRMISVDYTGNIYPCIRYMPNSLGDDAPPLTIGHVDTGIMVTEKDRACVECMHKVDRRTQSTDECFYCPIAEGCSWCSAYNYQCFGTVDKRATYICIMHKARCLANAYYWNKYFRARGENKRFKLYIPEEWALEIISEDEWKMLKELEGA